MIAAKITQEEKDSTRATVDEDRKHAIEAAIVCAHPPVVVDSCYATPSPRSLMPLLTPLFLLFHRFAS